MTIATATLRKALAVCTPRAVSSRSFTRVKRAAEPDDAPANDPRDAPAANGPHPAPDPAAHLALVERVANRLAPGLPSNISREELVSAGYEGLVRAARRFDPRKGERFEAYAEFRVKGAMLDEIRRHDPMSRGGRLARKALERKSAQLTAELGRPPTDDEVAEALGMDVGQFRDAVARLGNARLVAFEHASVEAYAWGRDSAGDPEAFTADLLARARLWDAVERLAPRHRLVIEMYFKAGHKLSEIGEHIGTTDSRVCQIKAEAIAQLRALMA